MWLQAFDYLAAKAKAFRRNEIGNLICLVGTAASKAMLADKVADRLFRIKGRSLKVPFSCTEYRLSKSFSMLRYFICQLPGCKIRRNPSTTGELAKQVMHITGKSG